MTQMSNYLETALLDHVLRNTAYTSPVNVYGQLHTGDPGEDGTANVSTETTRQLLTFNAAAGRLMDNSAQVDWLNIGVSAQETITHLSIWDASTAGNHLAYSSAATGTVVDPGDDFFIGVNEIDLSLDTSIFTTFLANALLDHVFRNTAYTQPLGLFFKAHLGAPGFDATANPAAETTRQSATFGAATAGTASNSVASTWTSVSTTENWSHWSLWDTVGPAGGNALLQGALTSVKNLQAGNNAEFAIGDAILNFD